MKSKKITPVTLSIFKNLFAAICEEMGVTLARSAFSTNIKERKDFSCALFDHDGRMIAQAAHIPVHLGSMPLSVAAAIRSFDLAPGDAVILNDPYQGGTHLPDITFVSPVFVGRLKRPAFYVATRAHHADIGGQSPGSMPLATHVEAEGVVIPPTLYYKGGRPNRSFLKKFLAQVRDPKERQADLAAQHAANRIGTKRLLELTQRHGIEALRAIIRAHRRYENRITRQALSCIPKGRYRFTDYLDDDGLTTRNLALPVLIDVTASRVVIDFTKAASQVSGPVNAPYAVTLSAVAYVFRSLILALTGEDCLSLEPITLKTKAGTIVDARYPAPVAGGNVETSQRIVDVLFGALTKALPQLIPAASQGTMNNLACGNADFGYYETLAGGMGARPKRDGIDAIHTHMTNTMNTPIEALESALPLRITQYKIRKGSGGRGRYKGGDGLIREYEFLNDTRVSLLTERRRFSPYGLRGGTPGKAGRNYLITRKGKKKLPGKAEFTVPGGGRVRIETPGGGGYGKKKRM